MSTATWEFREVAMPRGTSREIARQWLTATAEMERWELDRLRLAPDGRRTVRLRRKVYRVQRTTGSHCA
jgi:sirohydrochlorin ferrochelatase